MEPSSHKKARRPMLKSHVAVEIPTTRLLELMEFAVLQKSLYQAYSKSRK
jgi:hypothetical protein